MGRSLDSLPRFAARLAFPYAIVFWGACGGSDVVDSVDASGSLDGSLDGNKRDGDARLLDAGDATSSDAEGGIADADGGAGDSALNDSSLETGLDTGLDVGLNDAADSGDGGLGLLGNAKNFVILAGTEITVTATPGTMAKGDVGVSPGTSILTFPSGQPDGTVFAGGAVAAKAQGDLTTAYDTLAGMACGTTLTGDLGGRTLAPGVYCYPATSAGLTGALILDAQLNPNAVWVIQIGTTLTTATVSTVTVINGGSACNVYWQIGSSATLGTGTVFLGNVVALTSITLVTGATMLTGRALARNGAVTLDGNIVSNAACK